MANDDLDCDISDSGFGDIEEARSTFHSRPHDLTSGRWFGASRIPVLNQPVPPVVQQRTEQQMALERSFSDLCRSSITRNLDLPWQHSEISNVLSLNAFKLDTTSSFVVHPFVEPKSANPVIPAQTVLASIGSTCFTAVNRRLKHVDWPAAKEARAQRSLLKWRFIIEEGLQFSGVGRQMHDAVLQCRPDSFVSGIVANALGTKSPNTLSKRANSLLSFLQWHRTEFGYSGLPLRESVLYDFATSSKNSLHFKPTTLSSLLSALRFAGGCIGLDDALNCADSPRLKGLASKHLAGKAPLKQRRELKVAEVKILEHGVFIQKCKEDRIASGFFAAQLHSRGRFTGLQTSSDVIVDRVEDAGFLEFRTLNDKVQKTSELKTKFLPYVMPMVGVSRRNWADEWIKLLVQDGLAVASREDVNVLQFPRGYILPVPAPGGGWHDRPAEVADATRWLRDLLATFGMSSLEAVGTHSLKHTPLSWAAKYLMPLEIRTLLGHHSLGLSKSALTYSRDAQVLPLKHYQDMIYAIAMEKFDPDQSRSGRIFSRPAVRSSTSTAIRAEPGEDADEQASLADQSSESSSSSDSDEGTAEALAPIAARVPLHEFDLAKAADEGVLYAHMHSKLLHFKYRGQLKLACQRALTKNFCKVSAKEAVISMPCRDCFRTLKKS